MYCPEIGLFKARIIKSAPIRNYLIMWICVKESQVALLTGEPAFTRKCPGRKTVHHPHPNRDSLLVFPLFTPVLPALWFPAQVSVVLPFFCCALLNLGIKVFSLGCRIRPKKKRLAFYPDSCSRSLSFRHHLFIRSPGCQIPKRCDPCTDAGDHECKIYRISREPDSPRT